MDYKRPILQRCGFISSPVELASLPHPPRLRCAEVTGWTLVNVGGEHVGKSFPFGTTAPSRSEVEEGGYR